jgi:hypothetical protein
MLLEDANLKLIKNHEKEKIDLINNNKNCI